MAVGLAAVALGTGVGEAIKGSRISWVVCGARRAGGGSRVTGRGRNKRWRHFFLLAVAPG